MPCSRSSKPGPDAQAAASSDSGNGWIRAPLTVSADAPAGAPPATQLAAAEGKPPRRRALLHLAVDRLAWIRRNLAASSEIASECEDRSTTLVRLLHGFVLLPSGISGKMNISLDTTTIIAMLVVSFLSLCLVTYHLFVKAPKMP